MKKKVLSEQSLYYGYVNMPKGFEIDREELVKDISSLSDSTKKHKFSRNWDKLNTYIKDHIDINFKISLTNKNSWGNVFQPNKLSEPFQEVDPIDLKNSADFTMLYGVKVDKCWVRIYFDDNRRKGRSWDVELKNNMFIMFPATNTYIILNANKKNLNFIQTTTYQTINESI